MFMARSIKILHTGELGGVGPDVVAPSAPYLIRCSLTLAPARHSLAADADREIVTAPYLYQESGEYTGGC
jgi:hypothetical protein